MKSRCHAVKKLLGLFHAGALPPEKASAVETHLRQCPVCRDAARRAGLHTILQAGSRAPVPEPSDFFMARLHSALRDSPAPQAPQAMADLLTRSTLRLAPVMVALVMLVSIGSAWFAAPHDNFLEEVPAEELLLDDHPLSIDLMLAAMAGETLREVVQ